MATKSPEEFALDQKKQFDIIIADYAKEHNLSLEEALKKRHLENMAKYSQSRMETRIALTEKNGYYDQKWEDIM